MQITAVRVLRLTGGRAHDEPLWVERHGGPLSVYPEFRALPPGPASDGGREAPPPGDQTTATFLQVDTDEGVTGIASAAGGSARIIATELRPLLLGRDPLATERLWDVAYRALIHGRKGAPMMALSSVDCALWDLKGKWLGQPVYRLLGGPTRETIPAYASALGYSEDPQRAAERAQRAGGQGFRATKWFFRHGPGSGKDGIELNVALVRALRDAIGADVDLMLDAWMSWDLPYAVQMGRRIAEFGPRWLEEPIMPDKMDVYAQIRRALRRSASRSPGASTSTPAGGSSCTWTGVRGRAPAGHLLVRGALRDAQDLRPGLHVRPPGDPPRALRAGHLPPASPRAPQTCAPCWSTW